jgi:excisionase family DNA binding protein
MRRPEIQSPVFATLSIHATARLTGLSRATLYRLIGANRLWTVKVGRRRLVPLPAIRDLLLPPPFGFPVPSQHQSGDASSEPKSPSGRPRLADLLARVKAPGRAP